MSLKILLAKRKKALVQTWFDHVLETYPANTAKFLTSQNDPFANPVGQTLVAGLDALFDGLLNGMAPKTAAELLDPIVRIRAVQDFSPSRAVAFILSLKNVLETHVRKKFPEEFCSLRMISELRELEAEIDALCLVAFDVYMACREKIYQLKAEDAKGRSFKAFQRAGLVVEVPDIEAGSKCHGAPWRDDP
ncbi:MAG: RsbRD N-terminal domain-containing protein [Desulfobacterales bacterium]|nr:RsbRD N-terminal domain-containing protein [Desulfobacterales bacterium]